MRSRLMSEEGVSLLSAYTARNCSTPHTGILARVPAFSTCIKCSMRMEGILSTKCRAKHDMQYHAVA